MRLVHVLVSGEQRDVVLRALAELDVDYVVTPASDGGDNRSLVEFPIPSDAVGDVFETLREAGVAEESYVVVGTAETATTATIDLLEDRYASDFSPLTPDELRSKVRDLSHDWYSFVWLVALSALIAAGGLIADSPAIVVGSMVIAPLVGPILTAGVGAVTDEREMLVASVWFQASGLVVAVLAAAAFGFVLRAWGVAPTEFGLTALELVSLRLAPTMVAIGVGVAAGMAAAFALTTKGPTALVGVMIAAALVPAAATTGVALVWGELTVAVGAFVLLVVTTLCINVGVTVVLWSLGYRPDESGDSGDESDASVGNGFVGDTRRRAVRLLALVVLVVAVTGALAGTYQQLQFERDATRAVSDVVSRPAYGGLDVVAVRSDFGFGSVSGPRTVTVMLRRTSNRAYPALPGQLQRRVAARTGSAPVVRVRYVDYAVARPQPSNGSSGSYPTASTAASRTPRTLSSSSILM